MSKEWLQIKQLDMQLKELIKVSFYLKRPYAGWVKTIRTVLCMTSKQLAERMGLSQSRVTQIETSETHDAITLRALRQAAEAMECELVYAIIPKNNSSLEAIIKQHADALALQLVKRVSHTMTLEDQTVDPLFLEKQKKEISESLRIHLNKKFWDDTHDKSKYL